MKNIFKFLLLSVLLSVGYADADEKKEIDFLLSFITASDCTFIRNGKEYKSQEASEHLEYKYNHVKSRIKTADDFINRIASKSSISKKPYEVQCGDKRLKSGPWLTEALRSHRERAVR